MCGRFSCSSLTFGKALLDIGVTNVSAFRFEPHFNVGPMDLHSVILKNKTQIVVQPGRWGITPQWNKNPTQKIHNAKLETVGDKPTFKKAFLFQRCLIPVDGFYEWKQAGKIKQPYWFHQEGQEIFFLAGLYFVEEGELRFVVLTQEAKQPVASIHHRQPVIVPPSNAQDWLTMSGIANPIGLVDVDVRLESRQVTRKVNNTTFDQPECIQLDRT